MISRLQGWALTAMADLAVLVGAYAAGGRAARRSVEVERSRREAKTRGAVRDVDRKIDSMDDRSVVDRAGHWVRNNRR